MNHSIPAENCDIVILALARWDGPYSSPAFSLAKKLAKSNRVFYIDNPFTFSDYFKPKVQHQIKKRYNSFFKIKQPYFQEDGLPQNLFLITPPLVFPINLLPEGKVYGMSNELNSARVKSVLNFIIKEFKIKNYLFVNSFNPFYGFLNNASVDPMLKIYYTIDEISQSNYIKKHGPKLERKVLSEADATLATSMKLVSNCREVTENVYYFPNAADFSLFNSVLTKKYDRPEELKGIGNKKVICYTGHIEHRTDFKLLYKVAEAHHDKIILMVGPVSGTETLTSGLSDLPNVIFTGSKPLSELPAYLQHVHCTIIPYKRNKLTESIYPLKINEYLAAGKPVVATPFSKDIQSFAEVIALADNEKDFAGRIEDALQSDGPAMIERRVNFAKRNTWEARVEEFWNVVKEHAPSETANLPSKARHSPFR